MTKKTLHKPKTTAQRVAKAEAKKRQLGFKKIWVWAHPEDNERIRAYVAKLNKKREQ